MFCNCVHNDICGLRRNIINAFNDIIEKHFGGTNPKWLTVMTTINEVCHFKQLPCECAKQKEGKREVS